VRDKRVIDYNNESERLAPHFSDPNPRKAALIFGKEVVSYEQLDDSTTRLARWFLREGLQPADRVAIHWSNSIEVVTLFFACFKARLIAVPVNIRMKAPEIGYVLTHSKSAMCFSQPELAPLAKEAGQDCPSLRGIFTHLPALDAEETDQPALPQVDADATAILLYTSAPPPGQRSHPHPSVSAGHRKVDARRCAG